MEVSCKLLDGQVTTYTVLFLMVSLTLFKSSLNRFTEAMSMSISTSVHLPLYHIKLTTLSINLWVRVRSHRCKCESEYPYTHSSKHEFACISRVAVHIDTSSVQVRVTCEFHSYEQFLCRSCFCPNHMMQTARNLY